MGVSVGVVEYDQQETVAEFIRRADALMYADIANEVIVFGPGSIDQAHKPDEYIAIDQLQECLTMLERLGAKLR